MIQRLGWRSLEDRRRDARLTMLYKIDRELVAISKTDRLDRPTEPCCPLLYILQLPDVCLMMKIPYGADILHEYDLIKCMLLIFIVSRMFFVLVVFVLCVVYNVARVSGLSILDCPFGCCLSFCTFSLDHCVVCPSIYWFWLPLWYLQTLLRIPNNIYLWKTWVFLDFTIIIPDIDDCDKL
jgi:hypothetical protein